MMIPIRCFSCGKPLASEYEEFKKRVDSGDNPDKVMAELGVKRYCCRRMIFSQADIIDDIAKYES